MSDKFAGGIKAGSTSVSLGVFLHLADQPYTGLTAAGTSAYYWRQGGAPTAIGLADLSAVTATYSSGGWIEVDGANMAGIYRLDVPNAALATGADWVVVFVIRESHPEVWFYERIALETKGSSEVYTIIEDTVVSIVATILTDVESGAFGLSAIKTLLNTVAGYVDTEVAAIKAKTDNLPGSPAAVSNIPTVAQIWNQLLTAITTAGSIGKLIKDDLDAKISSRVALGTGAHSVTVRTLLSGNPVVGMVVSIFSEGAQIVAWSITNSQGEAQFHLDDGGYIAGVNSTPPYEPEERQEFTVAGANTTVTFNLTAQTPSPPASAQLCRVYGYVYNSQGLPAQNAKVSFKLQTEGTAEMGSPGTAFLIRNEALGQTDAGGYFFVDLLRSSQVNPWVSGNSKKYFFTCEDAGISNIEITVPDSPTYNLVTALP